MLKPDEIRRGNKVWGISPEPHITSIGDVTVSISDHIFYGVITEIEAGEKTLVKITITKPSVEQRYFEITDELMYTDELNYHPDNQGYCRDHTQIEEPECCGHCFLPKTKTGEIHQLILPGHARVFLCRHCWIREMHYRRARNRELDVPLPILEWKE